MHLLIFDIDGTLIDSVGIDDACYVQAIREMHAIDLGAVDWNAFRHVTDQGIAEEVFMTRKGRQPRKEELASLKQRFHALLQGHSETFREVPGARKMVARISQLPEVALAVATGGWRHTASLKLSAAGFDLKDVPIVTSDDHADRREITRVAIERARALHTVREFATVTYVGDGLWDARTAHDLGIRFVGVDVHANRRLQQAGVQHVLTDFRDLGHAFRCMLPEITLS